MKQRFNWFSNICGIWACKDISIRTTPVSIRNVAKNENNVLLYKLDSHLTQEELSKYTNIRTDENSVSWW